MNPKKKITVFGSSRPREGERDYEVARELGKRLGAAGFTICNGGYGGTMEAAARGAKEAGGVTIGVTCEFFSAKANPWVDQNIVVKALIERLMKLIELGDAYVVLRGGTGTLLELASVWELINKKAIREKPFVVVGSFWRDLIMTIKKELLIEGLESSTRSVTLVETAEECVIFLKEKMK